MVTSRADRRVESRRSRRRRWIVAVVVALAGLAALGVATTVPGGGERPELAAASDSSTTTDRPATTTSTSVAPTTTTAPAPPSTTTTTAPPPPAGLTRGASGPEVEALQRRLVELRFDPGPVDGRFGSGTLAAVLGFQSLHGMEADGVVGPMVEAALAAPAAVAPLVPGGEADRVEGDLDRQVLRLSTGGELHLVSHVSTGSGERYCEGGSCAMATTPTGDYRFTWRWPGWRTSRLGRLYNPVYFNGGIAIHGALSVPDYPASHGCVRIPMHIAEYFPGLVDAGDAVHVVAA
ncbi:hypothetical protein BH18ACT1_BH18ACT1_16710 [soil metagenome]